MEMRASRLLAGKTALYCHTVYIKYNERLDLSVSGTKKRVDDVTAPRTIHEVSERALNCGLTLPGEFN